MATGTPAEEARAGPFHPKGDYQESKNDQAEEVTECTMTPSRQM